MESSLPSIPDKRYFTIGEVGDLCGVKPHVLRYWEQEFSQLKPMKRRGNRRYYQHHEVMMIRSIRDLLYDQGFTISGARNKMQELLLLQRSNKKLSEGHISITPDEDLDSSSSSSLSCLNGKAKTSFDIEDSMKHLRRELIEIRLLLGSID